MDSHQAKFLLSLSVIFFNYTHVRARQTDRVTDSHMQFVFGLLGTGVWFVNAGHVRSLENRLVTD